MLGFAGSTFDSSGEMAFAVLCGSTVGGLDTTVVLDSAGITGTISGRLVSDFSSGFGDSVGFSDDVLDPDSPDLESVCFPSVGEDSGAFPGIRIEKPCLLSKLSDDGSLRSPLDKMSTDSDSNE